MTDYKFSHGKTRIDTDLKGERLTLAKAPRAQRKKLGVKIEMLCMYLAEMATLPNPLNTMLFMQNASIGPRTGKR